MIEDIIVKLPLRGVTRLKAHDSPRSSRNSTFTPRFLQKQLRRTKKKVCSHREPSEDPSANGAPWYVYCVTVRVDRMLIPEDCNFLLVVATSNVQKHASCVAGSYQARKIV